MKVFGCKMSSSYSGGLILVAANTLEEAYKVFLESDYAYLADFDYLLKNWKEYELLTANVEKPVVILEESYIE